jgi:predicted ArsR family transcriptional regulator
VRVRAPPGAVRPAKRYRRGDGELTVTIPPREYDLAGHIMAEAISEHASAATPIAEALAKAAASHGREIGAGCGRLDPTAEVLDRCLDLLVQHGYSLTNCPFHSLAQSHTQLVGQMNHALLDAFARSVAPDLLEVRLEPGDGRCCVTLSENPSPARP